MDNSLTTLTEALKKIIWQLKPQQNALSFILLIGKKESGKTALLRQSSFEHLTINEEHAADIYYNAQGIILELNEEWLNERNTILQNTLKELNRCHRLVRISGLLMTIDINTLCSIEAPQVTEIVTSHAELLQRFSQALGHRIDAALVFTKLDGIAGFSDFFQLDHVTELSKPLGFSLDWGLLKGKLANNFRTRFDHWIHALEQQVIHKMHPIRSSLKRTLIREFPLQLANLRHTLQTLLSAIPATECRVQSIYYTSAEQGGISIDHLNKKIQQEYALTVPDRFSQSTNYRAYFLEGALLAFQQQTKRHIPRMSKPQQIQIFALAGVLGLSIAWITRHFVESRHTLDHISKELLAYDAGINQTTSSTKTLYHLSKASTLLETYSTNLISTDTITKLRSTLKNSTTAQLNHDFLPVLLTTVEQVLTSPEEAPVARYQALKIYLMLNEPKVRVEPEILAWFKQQWQAHGSTQDIQQLTLLLKQVLRSPGQPIAINQQIVRDVRNYLNALPMSYLYYSLAKQQFPKTKEPIEFQGFTLPEHDVPTYFTKNGFSGVLAQLPTIANTLETENWVLMRQDLAALDTHLQEAYCYDYVMWWQHFTQRILLTRAQNYQEASQLTRALHESEAIHKIIAFIQTQTSPDFNNQNSVFNRLIASQFTSINLVSPASIRELIRTIQELQPFLMTLGVVHDEGRSAFLFSKTRFQNDNRNNPLTILYSEAQQFPEPIASWVKQLADDTWYLVMNDTKNFINYQWQQTVFQTYQQTISNRYPFDTSQAQEVSIADFNHFFSSNGILQHFVEEYLKPFVDTSHAEWRMKDIDNYMLPISNEMLSELIRANVITAMFFPAHRDMSQIEFSLQKLNLDPIISHFELTIGNKTLTDTQRTDSLTHFQWPEPEAKLLLSSIEGQEYELDEHGPWAFFKMLQKVNVLVDVEDSSSLQILFEVNGNSGRYLLKTASPLNPFTPGILNGFSLNEFIANT